MLSEIQENVDEAVADLSRRSERASVVPVPPHRTVAAPDAIERAGHATGEAVDTRSQAIGGVSLDDEMNVVGLNGEMHDAEVLATRGGECQR